VLPLRKLPDRSVQPFYQVASAVPRATSITTRMFEETRPASDSSSGSEVTCGEPGWQEVRVGGFHIEPGQKRLEVALCCGKCEDT
jgi:hypothetical protein